MAEKKVPNLKAKYAADVAPALMQKFGYKSTMEIPRIAKIVVNCGCGEGCQLCKTICTDFAPKVVSPDKLEICQEDCVACGMCFNRCPNGNIEMVDLGEIL